MLAQEEEIIQEDDELGEEEADAEENEEDDKEEWNQDMPDLPHPEIEAHATPQDPSLPPAQAPQASCLSMGCDGECSARSMETCNKSFQENLADDKGPRHVQLQSCLGKSRHVT